MLNSKVENGVDCSLWHCFPEDDANKTPDCDEGLLLEI